MTDMSTPGVEITPHEVKMSLNLFLDTEKSTGPVVFTNIVWAQPGQGAIMVDFGWVDNARLTQLYPEGSEEAVPYGAAPVARVAMGLATARMLKDQLDDAIKKYEAVLRATVQP